jgi:hypothetical protein
MLLSGCVCLLVARHCVWYTSNEGRAIAQAVSRWLLIAAAPVRARVCSSGICGGQNRTEAGFLQYFGVPCQSLFHQVPHHNHPGQVQ